MLFLFKFERQNPGEGQPRAGHVVLSAPSREVAKEFIAREYVLPPDVTVREMMTWKDLTPVTIFGIVPGVYENESENSAHLGELPPGAESEAVR